MQWPANFDWGTTRAVNRPVSTLEKTHEEKIDKNQSDVSDKGSVAGDSDIIQDELDHVALKKAFRFAATSSVALVGFLLFLIFRIF